MILYPAEKRYTTEIDWLKSHHSFSFGEHYHPENKGFGNLRVINEDYIKAGAGFGWHPHRDMEIITYLISGTLRHRDSAGNEGVIKPGDIQRISSGSGILHSEFNESDTEDIFLYQLWVKPKSKGGEPNYNQKHFPVEEKRNKLQLLASENGRDNSIDILQNLDLYASVLDQDFELIHKMKNLNTWVQIVAGNLAINGKAYKKGDGIAFDSQEELKLKAISQDTEILLFDFA